MTLLVVIVLGAFVGIGIVLLVDALTPKSPDAVAKPESQLLAQLQGMGRKLPISIGAGLLVLVMTGWVVAAIAGGLLAFFWNRLFGGAGEEKRGIARVEALAAWTESVRDTVAGAVGLEQAIPATAYAASPVIQEDLMNLSDRLRVRVPLPLALQRFAEEMDDPSADLIIAALILNSRLRGPGLREVLTSLAESARAELDMRQRVAAGRKGTRRSVQIVTFVTVAFVTVLALFNPTYVEPYNSPVGQIVLIGIIGVFALGVMWLRRLAAVETPQRFLHFRKEAEVAR